MRGAHLAEGVVGHCSQDHLDGHLFVAPETSQSSLAATESCTTRTEGAFNMLHGNIDRLGFTKRLTQKGQRLNLKHLVVCVVWCGVVWCGVVWCGVVWCGVVWCGVVWCGVVWCGVVWCGVVWCGAVRWCVWCGVVWCGVVWCVVWCGVVWCVEWCGVWCGVVWCGVVWCGVVCVWFR